MFPQRRIVDLFLVSDRGVSCRCTAAAARDLPSLDLSGVRRLIVIQPHWLTVRALMVLKTAPERVLLLGDTASAALATSELNALSTMDGFKPFARRATALAQAIGDGGAAESFDIAESHFRFRTSGAEDEIDFTQAADSYRGPIVRFRLASGTRVSYRPSGDVLVFSPDEARPFRRTAARAVQPGQQILVLGRDARDKLAEAFAHSRKTLSQLRQYHECVARVRTELPGSTLTDKARAVLGEMQRLDSAVGGHELPNVKRWLSVEPMEGPQQPRAARDRRRFGLFTTALGVDSILAESFWNYAVVPSRAYSALDGYVFNRRIVQFILDPEGVAGGTRAREYEGLWHSLAESVDEVLERELFDG